MIRFLLDTDVCIEVIRARAPGALSRLRRCRPGSVGISSITFAELHYGVARSSAPERNARALTLFAAPLEILPFDDRAALAYGQVRADLEKAGVPIGPLDLMIAAHALSRRAVLVTANEREFGRIEGLRVENWVRS